jgi:hypothetical protein
MLGAQVREEDRRECLDGNPWRALTHATQLGGDCWTALRNGDPDDILGAYGWTDLGTIWSLWRKLTRAESLSVLTHTPLWVREMLRASGRAYLYNRVYAHNKSALAWLTLSKCFTISTDKELTEAGQVIHYFETRPLEHLP